MAISRAATSQQITKVGRKVGGLKKQTTGSKRPRGGGRKKTGRNNKVAARRP